MQLLLHAQTGRNLSQLQQVKKVDLKTKLQFRTKGLYLPSPLLCRTSELKGRLLFVKQIANNWRASSG